MKYPKDSKIIKEICHELHITSYTLAKNLNYKSPSSIYHVEKGLNQITTIMANKIIAVYPQFNFNYLIGKGGKEDKLIATDEMIKKRGNLKSARSDKVNIRRELNEINFEIKDLRLQISELRLDIQKVMDILIK